MCVYCAHGVHLTACVALSRPAEPRQPALEVQLHRRRGGDDRAGGRTHRAVPQVSAHTRSLF